MTISLEAQGQAFLLTLGMGALLGLYYDLLRLPRLLLPPRWAQELLDLLFWLGAFFLLFLCATWLEGGRVRLYLGRYINLYHGSFAALAARLLGFLLSPLRRLGSVLTAQWAKFIRPRLENWKKSFSFSQRWSTMSQFHCLHRRVSRRKKEVSHHAAQQKGWSDPSAPSPGPSGLHGHYAGPGPGADHDSLQRPGPAHRPGLPAAPSPGSAWGWSPRTIGSFTSPIKRPHPGGFRPHPNRAHYNEEDFLNRWKSV